MRALLRFIVIVVVIGAVVAGGVYLSGQQGQPASADDEQNADILDETIVDRSDLSVTVSGTGSLLPARQTALVFAANAPVIEVLKPVGAFVEEGEVIARIDATDFLSTLDDAQLAVEAQELAFNALTAPARDVDVAVAEAAVTAAQAAYNAALQTGPDANQREIARLQIELARNQLWQSQLQAETPIISIDLNSLPIPDDIPDDVINQINEQLAGLFAPDRASAETGLRQLEYQVQIAGANYDSVQSQGPDLGSLNSANAGRIQAQIALDRLLDGAVPEDIEQASIQLEQARLALEQARTALKNTELTAPFSGVIAENNLIAGQLPPTRDPSIVIMDTSHYFLDLPIDETDIVQVSVGQGVEIVLDALPNQTLTGTVTRVSQTPTRIGNLVTYLARVQLDSTDAPIRVGMSATARITTQEVNDVLVLRNNFIRIDRNTQRAYVTVAAAGGGYEEIEVTLGVRNDTLSEIVSGLEEGQQVVLLPRRSNLFGFGGGPGGGAGAGSNG